MKIITNSDKMKGNQAYSKSGDRERT